MIKNLIQKYLSEEERYCLEMHNELRWYFSIEHPAPPVSDCGENAFFIKHNFLIIKNLCNSNVPYEKVLEFLQKVIPDIEQCRVVFGKKKLYFSDVLKFIDLDKEDFIIFNPNKVDFLNK